MGRGEGCLEGGGGGGWGGGGGEGMCECMYVMLLCELQVNNNKES